MASSSVRSPSARATGARPLALAGLSAASLLLAGAPDARAERWIPIGARERALGGAGVAANEDALSLYWNPANLSFLPLNREPYAAAKKKLDDAARDAKEATGAHKMTPEEEAAIKDESGSGDDDKLKDNGKWTGYEAFQLQIAANGELLLTGDVVARAGRIDSLIKNSDIEGAADRASAIPPTVTQQDFRNLVKFYEEIEGLNDGGDGIAELAGGLFTRYKWFGLGLYTNTYAGIRPRVDLNNNAGFSDTAQINEIGDQLRTQGGLNSPPQTAGGQALANELLAAIPGLSAENAGAIALLAEQSGVDLNNQDLRDALRIASQQSGAIAGGGIRTNTSGARVNAISTQELALTVAIPLSEEIGLPLPIDMLGIGIVPKLMRGITATEEVRVVDVLLGDESFDDISKSFFNSREESMTFGIDAGITLQPTSWLRLGLVGRNLNDPEFKFKGGGKYQLRHQVRAGFAIRPVASIMLCADMDVAKNHSDALPGLRSRQVGGGIEWNPDWRLFGFALRGGMYGDLEDKRGGFRPVLTGGMGFKFAVVTINIAGSFALKRENFRDYEIPSDVGLALDFGLTW